MFDYRERRFWFLFHRKIQAMTCRIMQIKIIKTCQKALFYRSYARKMLSWKVANMNARLPGMKRTGGFDKYRKMGEHQRIEKRALQYVEVSWVRKVRLSFATFASLTTFKILLSTHTLWLGKVVINLFCKGGVKLFHGPRPHVCSPHPKWSSSQECGISIVFHNR